MEQNLWRTEDETRQTGHTQDIHQSVGGTYLITELVSVLSSMHCAGQQAGPIITHCKASHGEKRGTKRQGENKCHVIHSN